ncbi:IclR family transcriptional regulator [Gordonia sp. LSe1-13]|uniref:IclR family transcriptional regulator n=1 Tax=Gordonia sesuvii TaxID=3116777 RepID=A0ABU7MAU0_9ACTN|nr:IclR family transcriptional regulator [Gordonia sp. LSe1-13]
MSVTTLAPQAGSAESPSTVLERVALLLEAFDEEALTLTDVVNRTGLPRSSAHRMLDRLVGLGWLRRTGRNYQLGLRLVEFGSLALHQDELHRAALPLLQELHRITGMVVHLGVLTGSDVLYLEKIEGRLGPCVPTRRGGRFPAHKSAIGHALLAYEEQTGIDQSLTTSLQRSRETGIAIERGQNIRGFSCLAAPVGPPGRPVAAISICGPTARMSFDHKAVAPIRMASAAIWQNLDRCSGQSTNAQRRRNLLHSLPSAELSA